MKVADFRYNLPQALIAQHPTAQRSASRLLVMGKKNIFIDQQFTDFINLVEPGDLLVLNDTRVMKARLFGQKSSGGQIEVLIERLRQPHQALAHIRASKAPKAGSSIQIASHPIQVIAREDDLFVLETAAITFTELMDQHGHVPLPPYIERTDEKFDEERYQTVFSDRLGAIAAPTAGLHFSDTLFAQLKSKDVDIAKVTLHVGAGTFQPVRVEDTTDHVMHKEWVEVTQTTLEAIENCHNNGKRVIAIGTTVVRSLETAAFDGSLQPYSGDTELFITPGFNFKVVDALVTNFHLPESTLLMLVCAFAGYEPIMAAYQHAIAQKYRFFSYGDAMFLSRQEKGCGHKI